MLPLGTQAVPFSLRDAFGTVHSLNCSGKAAATLLVFMCNHCPYVILLKAHLSDFCRRWMAQDVQIFGINSNDPGVRQEDGVDGMREDVKRYGYSFPYLVDETQDVARAYRATCTPDFFLFDREMKLAYRGQYDGSRPGNGKPVTGADLEAALRAVLKGGALSPVQLPSMGCSIKWREA